MKEEKGETNYPLTLMVTIIIVASMACIGYFSFITITDDISGPTTSSQMNATISSGNTVFNIVGIVLVLGFSLSLVGIIYYYVSTPKRYKKLSKVFDFLVSTTYYFAWGLLSFVIIAVPSYLLWLLYQYSIVEGNTGSLLEVGKWVSIIVVAYFGIATLGYFVKKKLVDNYRKRKNEINTSSFFNRVIE